MNPPTKITSARARLQRGTFLLEVLIAILIVALGVLGLVALQSRAMQQSDDSHYRSEAAFLVNDYISQMWVSDPGTLVTNFSAGGTSYTAFNTLVKARLPGSTTAPVVTVAAGPTSGVDVVITIYWKPPWVVLGPENQYTAAATVRMN